MRALIKLGCVCKVNKMFARLFGGRVGAVLNFFRVEVLTTKKLKIVYFFLFLLFLLLACVSSSQMRHKYMSNLQQQ